MARYTKEQLYTLYRIAMDRAQDFHRTSMSLMSHSPSLAARDQKLAAFQYEQARFYRREYVYLEQTS
jgi:hypothetical protein